MTLLLGMFLAKSGMPKFLSVTIVSAKRGSEFDLETPFRLLLNAITMYNTFHCFDDQLLHWLKDLSKQSVKDFCIWSFPMRLIIYVVSFFLLFF